MSNRGQGSCIAPKVRCRGIANQTCLLAFIASAVAWLTCLSQAATAMTIYVLDSTYTSLTLEVEPSDSIDNVKQKTQDRTYIDPASQYLYFGGTLLEDGYTLSDYNVGRGSTLPLVATAAFSSTPLPNVVWNFGVNDVTAGAGVGWTLWQTNDPVDLSSYGPGAITFNVFGYNGLLAGTPSGYDPASPYSLTFLTAAGGINGFSASQFDVMGNARETRRSIHPRLPHYSPHPAATTADRLVAARAWKSPWLVTVLEAYGGRLAIEATMEPPVTEAG